MKDEENLEQRLKAILTIIKLILGFNYLPHGLSTHKKPNKTDRIVSISVKSIYYHFLLYLIPTALHIPDNIEDQG
jgi:hypothetical protein